MLLTHRFERHSQDLIVAQGLSRRAAIPAAVWDVPVGCDDVESVVDEVVLQDAVVGCAGGQRGRGVDLSVTRTKKVTLDQKFAWRQEEFNNVLWEQE